MSLVERNLNPSGRLSNVVFGLCVIFDGLVRVLSLGYLHTGIPLKWTRYCVKLKFRKLRGARDDLSTADKLGLLWFAPLVIFLALVGYVLIKLRIIKPYPKGH
jgi:hypothetical protein